MILRWDAPDAATLRRILADPPLPPLAGGIAPSPGPIRSTHFRDVYFDTAAGELRQRRGRCRLRFMPDGGRRLTVWQPDEGGQRIDERVRTVDDLAALAGTSEAARLLRALEGKFALRPAGTDALQRAITALDVAAAEGIGRDLRGEREVALVAVAHGRVGLCRTGAELRRLVGSGEGQLRLLAVVPRTGDRVPLEVWTARRLPTSSGNGETLQWFAPADLVARVGSPLLRDPATLAALTVAAQIGR